jgi:hypothetical protein
LGQYSLAKITPHPIVFPHKLNQAIVDALNGLQKACTLFVQRASPPEHPKTHQEANKTNKFNAGPLTLSLSMGGN